MAYTYLAYGLSCSSSEPILSFPAGSSEDAKRPDIVVTISAAVPYWAQLAGHLESRIVYAEPDNPQNPGQAVTVFGNDELFELAYSDGARFMTNRDATQLWARYAPPMTLEDVAIYLQGPVMGFALRRRGVTALHASAVCVGGRAIILCGPTEAGKSTTAAALGLQGAPVLCDDITPVRETNGILYADPGHSRVCLWPEAVRYLLGCENALPRLRSTWEKCFLPLDNAKATLERHECRLGAIYILGARTAGMGAPRIEEITGRERLLALLQNTYMNWLLDGHQRGVEFDVLSKIAHRVPIKRIIPHSDPTRLGDLCNLILRDATQLISEKHRRTLQDC